MATRITGVSLASLLSSTAVGRVSEVTINTLFNDRTKAPRTSQVTINTLFNDRTVAPRVSQINVYALVSVAQASPREVVTLEVRDLERNPYRPDTPTEIGAVDPVLDDFLGEQQRTIREQHNLQQAGDTTYPWSVLTQVSPQQDYTLGSLGRFFHDTFGVIRARYVRFNKLVDTAPYFNVPAGRLKSSAEVEWIVTNDFNKSGPDLVEGVIAAYSLPQDGWHGWIIIDGPNLASMNPGFYNLEEPPEQNAAYVWSKTGEVALTGEGRILGRRWEKAKTAEIPPGALRIRLEGPSDDSIKAMLEPIFKVFRDFDEAIDHRVSSLENAGLGDALKTLASLKTAVEKLKEDLTKEASARSKKDSELEKLIGKPATEKMLNDAITKLKNSTQQALDSLAAKIAALGGGIQFDPTDLQTAINTLTTRISELWMRGSMIPLVDGSVPPQLVYMPDGNLVLVEV